VDELTAFVTARLDEDEAAAKAAEHNDGPYTLEWRVGGPRRLTFDNHRSENYMSVFAGDWDRILIARDVVRDGPLATHIARHDPARVLRDVAAKRAILAKHGPDLPLEGACLTCYRGEGWPCDTLRLLAAIWDDHPDYRAGWAP
jgi:hypothetical protein